MQLFDRLKSDFIDNILQHILFKEDGTVVNSNNTLIELAIGDNLYDKYPLIHGIYHTFDNIEEDNLHMPRVELKELDGIYDVFVSKLPETDAGAVLFFLTLHDNTTNNQYLLEVQQERNNAVIAQELALLKLQNATLKEEVNIQTKKIEESLQYAYRIQNSLLSDILALSNADNIFVLWMPKDVVSGDFYWLYDDQDAIYYAMVDCTGHGVPGALLSVVGNLYLTEVIQYRKDPASILTELNHKVKTLLYNHNNRVQLHDGMEISLIKVAKNEKKITFSGAMRDIVVISDGEKMCFKGDRISINGHFELEAFQNHVYHYKPGDMVYLYSDGYPDQFGGPQNKKMTSKRFYDHLLDIYELPVVQQKNELKKVLKDWMGNNNQLDDITVIGLRLD